MKPKIEGTEFGSIEIDGKSFNHDVVIRIDGRIEKRKKKLSKAIYGTSHTISLDEAKHIYEAGAQRLIIGAGQFGLVHLSDEAARFYEEKKCKVEVQPSPDAITSWNKGKDSMIGLFHITC